MNLPTGDRQDTITYRVVDPAGMIRTSGLADEAQAVAWAQEHLDDPGATHFVIERTTYVSFTGREVVRVVGEQ